MLPALQHTDVYEGSSSTPVIVYTDHNPLPSTNAGAGLQPGD